MLQAAVLLKNILLLVIGIALVVTQKPLSVDYIGTRSNASESAGTAWDRMRGLIFITTGMILIALAATDLMPGIV